jgi:hypothetical protein
MTTKPTIVPWCGACKEEVPDGDFAEHYTHCEFLTNFMEKHKGLMERLAKQEEADKKNNAGT